MNQRPKSSQVQARTPACPLVALRGIPGRTASLFAFCVVFASMLLAPISDAATELRFGGASGLAGSTGKLSVELQSDVLVAGLELDILFDASVLTLGSPVAGPGLPNHRIEQADLGPGLKRVIIYSLLNLPFGNGVLLLIPWVASVKPSPRYWCLSGR